MDFAEAYPNTPRRGPKMYARLPKVSMSKKMKEMKEQGLAPVVLPVAALRLGSYSFWARVDPVGPMELLGARVQDELGGHDVVVILPCRASWSVGRCWCRCDFRLGGLSLAFGRCPWFDGVRVPVVVWCPEHGAACGSACWVGGWCDGAREEFVPQVVPCSGDRVAVVPGVRDCGGHGLPSAQALSGFGRDL